MFIVPSYRPTRLQVGKAGDRFSILRWLGDFFLEPLTFTIFTSLRLAETSDFQLPWTCGLGKFHLDLQIAHSKGSHGIPLCIRSINILPWVRSSMIFWFWKCICIFAANKFLDSNAESVETTVACRRGELWPLKKQHPSMEFHMESLGTPCDVQPQNVQIPPRCIVPQVQWQSWDWRDCTVVTQPCKLQQKLRES